MVIYHGIKTYKKQKKQIPSTGTPKKVGPYKCHKWGYFTPIIQVKLAQHSRSIPYTRMSQEVCRSLGSLGDFTPIYTMYK